MRDITLAAIDRANGEDPNVHDGEPLALVQGRAASRWLQQLDPTASDELQLVVRAHHLRRWELKRADFPPGRRGYLHWRRENKSHQAESLALLMEADGWPAQSIERTRTLLKRSKLRTDPETQSLEDAASLVFLETQFDELNNRLDHDHLVSVVAKTLGKLSESAISLAATIPLSAGTQQVLVDAIASTTTTTTPATREAHD